MFERGKTFVPPDVAKMLNNTMSDKSWIQSNPVLNAALKMSTQGKRLLLSFSPFHYIQEGLRGVQSGINPFNLESFDPTDAAHQDAMRYITVGRADAGGGLGTGDNALVHKIPGVGPVLKSVEDALFSRMGSSIG